ncbi:hypothetical protein RHGRI_012352 [Rhododendron griersonianum]|uniref:Uncharacterized protein n=1 Tax=Rhododendron griersonianum TaxID=479676 RepID=A0AAV6KRT6_9ERIC|nr:hypothetical protein RHGRI_012352 [Rhododendron griersonianum]
MEAMTLSFNLKQLQISAPPALSHLLRVTNSSLPQIVRSRHANEQPGTPDPRQARGVASERIDHRVIDASWHGGVHKRPHSVQDILLVTENRLGPNWVRAPKVWVSKKSSQYFNSSKQALSARSNGQVVRNISSCAVAANVDPIKIAVFDQPRIFIDGVFNRV